MVRIVRDGAGVEDETSIPSATTPARRSQNLFFTTNTTQAIARADIILMAVNTPTKMFGVGAGCATNMTAFDGAMREVATHAKAGAIIVEKSTVPGGTAERVRKMVGLTRSPSNRPAFLTATSWPPFAPESHSRCSPTPNSSPRDQPSRT